METDKVCSLEWHLFVSLCANIPSLSAELSITPENLLFSSRLPCWFCVHHFPADCYLTFWQDKQYVTTSYRLANESVATVTTTNPWLGEHLPFTPVKIRHSTPPCARQRLQEPCFSEQGRLRSKTLCKNTDRGKSQSWPWCFQWVPKQRGQIRTGCSLEWMNESPAAVSVSCVFVVSLAWYIAQVHGW